MKSQSVILKEAGIANWTEVSLRADIAIWTEADQSRLKQSASGVCQNLQKSGQNKLDNTHSPCTQTLKRTLGNGPYNTLVSLPMTLQ